MYNYQTYLDELRSKLTNGGLDSRSSAFISDVEALRKITDKLNRIEKKWKTQIKQENPNAQALTSGVSLYDAPVSVFGRSIEGVGVVESSGRILWLDRWTKARIQDIREFSELDANLDAALSDRPRKWFFEPGSPRKIRIRPAPNWTKAAGLLVRFAEAQANPRLPLNRSAFFCDVTRNSSTVNLFGLVDEMDVRVADEFGVCPTANSDGRSLSNKSPLAWYRIIDVDSETALSSEILANAGFTGSAASWTLSNFAYGSSDVVYSGTDVMTGYAEQTITMLANHTYRFSASWQKNGVANGTIAVKLNGTTIHTFGSSGGLAAGANTQTFDYDNTAFSGSVTVRFFYTPQAGDPGMAVEYEAFSVKKLGHQITLESNYDAATQTGANFITAQVPGIEQYNPRSIGYAPVWWAASDILQRRSPDMARQFKDDAFEILSEYVFDETGDDEYDRGISPRVQNRQTRGKGGFRDGLEPGSGSIVR